MINVTLLQDVLDNVISKEEALGIIRDRVRVYKAKGIAVPQYLRVRYNEILILNV